MADLPPDDDAGELDDAESRFLIRLWAHLDAAAELSVSADVLERLDAIVSHCEQAVEEVRAWQRGERA